MPKTSSFDCVMNAPRKSHEFLGVTKGEKGVKAGRKDNYLLKDCVCDNLAREQAFLVNQDPPSRIKYSYSEGNLLCLGSIAHTGPSRVSRTSNQD